MSLPDEGNRINASCAINMISKSLLAWLGIDNANVQDIRFK